MNARVEKFAHFNTCGLPGLVMWAVASGTSLKVGVQGASATNWFSRVNGTRDNGIRPYYSHSHSAVPPVLTPSHAVRRSATTFQHLQVLLRGVRRQRQDVGLARPGWSSSRRVSYTSREFSSYSHHKQGTRDSKAATLELQWGSNIHPLD